MVTAGVNDFKNVNKDRFILQNSGETQVEFLNCLRSWQDEIVGSETIGDLIEFYDEDGVVVLVVKADGEKDALTFDFLMDGKEFDVKTETAPDIFKSN